ncbi:MAG: DUF4864 domain-containing protein [Planctomycetota bacterium]|nr:DUF4864 domain-containing protein [Planctomycetota bacterium]
MSDSNTPGSDPQLNDTVRPPGSPPPPPGSFHVGQSSSGQIMLAPGFKPAFQIQDLTTDPLLAAAPRVSVLGRRVPALDGIPLLYKLGQGGMGAVYYGYHPRLDREVAVKVLPSQLAAQNPELVQRFFREARIAAKVHSPHLVGVLDVDQDGGLFFIVMEFVEGGSVRGYIDSLKKAGRTGAEEAVALDICIAAARGLGEAHARGIVHRDIKPDNILLPKGHDGHPSFVEAKLADLGLARGEGGEDTGLTLAHSSMGTPGYLAPEQATDARSAAPPADVYGMGATLYAMLAGHAPFTGTSAMKIMMDTVQKPHAPIRSVRADISPETAALLDRCLAKESTQRYANGNELLNALMACRGRFGTMPGAFASGGAGTGVYGGVASAPPQPYASGAAQPVSSSAPYAAVPQSGMGALPPRPASSGISAFAKLAIGCVGLTVLLGVAAVGGLLWLGLKINNDADAAVKAQLEAMARGDIDAAYEMTSEGFRRATSRADFEKFAKSYKGFTLFQSVALKEHTYKNGMTTVKGTITSTDGSTSELEYTVEEVGGVNKVLSIKINGPVAPPPEAVQTPDPEPKGGATRITAVVTGQDVDPKGILRQSKTTFSPRDGTIFVNVRVLNANPGSRITASLSQSGGSLKMGPVTQQITQDGPVVSTFSFAQPGSGWPRGRYEISVYISGGASGSQQFTVR